jgi:hypothetical protein
MAIAARIESANTTIKPNRLGARMNVKPGTAIYSTR